MQESNECDSVGRVIQRTNTSQAKTSAQPQATYNDNELISTQLRRTSHVSYTERRHEEPVPGDTDRTVNVLQPVRQTWTALKMKHTNENNALLAIMCRGIVRPKRRL